MPLLSFGGIHYVFDDTIRPTPHAVRTTFRDFLRAKTIRESRMHHAKDALGGEVDVCMRVPVVVCG